MEEICTPRGRRFCKDNKCRVCFDKSFASHEDFDSWLIDKRGKTRKYRCWSNENDLTQRQVFKNSHTKYWFTCDICFHDFEMSLDAISCINKPQFCQYCANQALCKNDECNTCFNKSFASHEKSTYWLINKNNRIAPRDVYKKSSKKFWFKCNQCFHEYYCTLNYMSNKSTSSCPYCSNPPKLLCDKNIDCKLCFNKSFASHKKSKYWSKRNNIIPREVFLQSNKQFWFICNKCAHDFEMSLDAVSRKNKPSWCHYCSNIKMCDKNIDCSICYNKSFASHEKAKYWIIEKNNGIMPREKFKGSDRGKYWFICDNKKCKHKFNITLNSINSGSWCPLCKHKTEKKVFKFIKSLYENVEYQPKFEWCKNIKTNRYLPFDIYVPELNTIVEIDGKQHFEYLHYFNKDRKIENIKEKYIDEKDIDEKDKEKIVKNAKERDRYKNARAKENGYSMIRICQEFASNANKYKSAYEIPLLVALCKIE